MRESEHSRKILEDQRAEKPPRDRLSRHWRVIRWRIKRERRSILIFATVVFLLAAISIYPIDRSGRRGGSPSVQCMSNLRQLGYAALLYAKEHQGAYPPNDVEFFRYAVESCGPAIFVCPSSKDRPASGPTTRATIADYENHDRFSYVYVGGSLNSHSPADAVLMYEPIGNHGEFANVLFNDGHAGRVWSEQFEKLMKELNSGHNPPREEMMK